MTSSPQVGVREPNGDSSHRLDYNVDELKTLFDQRFYERQAGREFDDATAALAHYVEEGAASGWDPGPYFDTTFYYQQSPDLAASGINALIHYVKYAADNRAYRPNPLFGNGYYLETNEQIKASGANPLVHYLRVGSRHGRAASIEHDQILQKLGRLGRRTLLRGRSTSKTALFLADGVWESELLVASRNALAKEYHLEPLFVFLPNAPVPEEFAGATGILRLDDYHALREISRPSALRLLTHSLAVRGPTIAFTESHHLLEPLHENDVPTYVIVPDFARNEGWPTVTALCRAAERVIIPSSDWLYAAAGVSGHCPPNVALRAYSASTALEGLAAGRGGSATPRRRAELFVRSVLSLAKANLAPARGGQQKRAPVVARKIVVPCSDWSVSGVNTTLEAVGAHLIAAGWQVEIVFTRDEAFVAGSAGSSDRFPSLPYTFLDRPGPGVESMWEALVDYVERASPCVLFMSYDFVGNSVVPALSDDVGVVMWLQADDGDYYEQAYRLGRYCNAVVCVSKHIHETVVGLHPGIGGRSHVIHNSSVGERDVVETRPPRSDRLRIVYTGRLVQYQKRVLDFVDLADALDELELPYEISLIGTFAVHDEAAGLFHERAARHLKQGKIQLLGRLSRERLFQELRHNDFFVLLSDFEGLPLSLGEAMAAGCVPVVSEMKSGVSEMLTSGENGLIVSGRDYEHWAEAIAGLWRDPVARSTMSRQARTTIAEGFTVERIAEQFDELFRSVAEEISTGYERPPALHWGERRSRTGDVLPPPVMYQPIPIAGLG